jgi:glucosylceramidase
VGSGNTVTASGADEWAEMVTSAAYYGYSHGHTFGVFSPNNEEDWGANEGIVMSAAVYASAMNKVASRLDALGMTSVRLIGPETANTVASYVTAMAGYPNLMAKIDHFDFHSYSGTTGGASGLVSSYSGKDFWMSEFSIFDHAFALLNLNAAGIMMWDAYDSVYNHAVLNGHGSSSGNDAGNAPAWIDYNDSTKVYAPRTSFYQFGQLFKYLPLGAQRVDVTSSNGSVLAAAFVHPTSGVVTICGKNNTGSTQIIGGTLAGTPAVSALHFSQTTTTSNMTSGPNVPVTNGTFYVTVPAGSVFTLTTM